MLKLIKEKLNNKGFSLLEMIFVTFLLGILSSIMAIAIGFGIKSYSSTVMYSEAKALASTVNTIISDELRYATNVTTGSTLSSEFGNVFFTSSTHGSNSRITDYDGKLRIVNNKATRGTTVPGISGSIYYYHEMLGKGAYTSYDLKLTGMAITYDPDTKIFDVSYIITDKNDKRILESKDSDDTVKTVHLQVKSLK